MKLGSLNFGLRDFFMINKNFDIQQPVWLTVKIVHLILVHAKFEMRKPPKEVESRFIWFTYFWCINILLKLNVFITKRVREPKLGEMFFLRAKETDFDQFFYAHNISQVSQ